MGIATTTDFGQLQHGQYKGTFDPLSGERTGYNVLLKEFWLPGVIDIINSKRVASRYLRRNTRDVMGKYIYTALNTKRNVGIMSSSEGAKLVAPGRQGNNKAQYYTKNNYGRILFTGQSASASRGRAGSNIRLMNQEVTGLARDIQSDDNRIFYGDGSGRLAQTNGTSTYSNPLTTIPVVNPNGITAQGPGTQFFEEGQRLCFKETGSESDPVFQATDAGWLADAAGVKVTEIVSIDPSTSTIVVTGDWSAVLSGVYMYKANEYSSTTLSLQDADTSRGKEMNGFAAVVSDTDPPLQRPNIDPDSNGLGNLSPDPNAGDNYEPRWAAFSAGNGGIPTPFNEGMFQTLITGVDLLGDGVLELFLGTHGVRDQWAFQLMEQKRFVNTRELPGGFKALTYNDIPFVPDKDCSRGRIYGLDLSTIELAYENDYHWREDGGSTLMALDDYDAWQATLLRYSEVICRARNANAVHRDIQDS